MATASVITWIPTLTVTASMTLLKGYWIQMVTELPTTSILMPMVVAFLIA